MIKPLVIGQSAWDIERIWHTIYRGRNAMHGSAVQSAIACIDIALWDIVGQKLNLPVYKLLGGKINDKIKMLAQARNYVMADALMIADDGDSGRRS
jgi:galactonate dehydratase